jgi:hypothetical protein
MRHASLEVDVDYKPCMAVPLGVELLPDAPRLRMVDLERGVSAWIFCTLAAGLYAVATPNLRAASRIQYTTKDVQ